METKILFHEEQKFTQWWLWLLLLAPLAYVIFAILSPTYTTDVYTSGNASFSMLIPFDYWIILIASVAIAILFFVVKMETKIDSDKIAVRHLFFVKKDFRWEEIASAEIIKYGFVGYGIRISLNHGTVYNVKGNNGLFITLKNGKKRLIGTQKPEEMRKVVEELRSLWV